MDVRVKEDGEGDDDEDEYVTIPVLREAEDGLSSLSDDALDITGDYLAKDRVMDLDSKVLTENLIPTFEWECAVSSELVVGRASASCVAENLVPSPGDDAIDTTGDYLTKDKMMDVEGMFEWD